MSAGSSSPPVDGVGRSWLLPILVGACVLMSAELSIQLTRHSDHVAAIWVSNAVVLAALLRTPASGWARLVLADALATALVSVLNGNSPAVACGFVCSNALEVLVCAIPLRAIAREHGTLDLARARHLAAFVFLTLGPASLCSAALAATTLALLAHFSFSQILVHWYAPHALGLLTLTPVLVSLDLGALRSLFDRRHLPRMIGCLLAMAATLGVVFSQNAYPLLFLTFPALMLVNFQLGFAGVVVALAMTVVVAIGATTKGTGPLLLVHGDLREQVLILQAYIAVAALTSLQLAAVLTGQERLQADLRRANAEALNEIAARAASERGADAARRDAEAAREEAVAANQAKSDFLAAVSHEIRTPLNSIIGFTELMLAHESQTALLRQYTEIVRSSGSALLTIVNDILDFSRLEAGDVELEAVPFALPTLCANALAIIGGVATTKDLDITATHDPRLPERVVGDPTRLQQVLLNLLNNAVKFTAEGRVELRVELERWADGRAHVRFLVSDTGIGIEEAKQDRLFKRFSQADASVSRTYGGSGLGLAICKRLVERMGGAIGVSSAVGRGSTFWFSVPLARAADEADVAAVATATFPRCGRLLLVEDVALNRQLACALLEGDGHRVDAVGSGEEAVEALRTRDYDLVLMDVQMPGMGGVAATKAIRALPSRATVPIIAMTANVLSDQVKACRTAGMDDHVGKPIDRAELSGAIARWLAPQPPGAHPVFDRDVFDAISTRLGPVRTHDALRMFALDLRSRLSATDQDAGDTFLSDAHVVTSMSGILGFTDLSRRCTEIAACPTGEEGYRTKVLGILRAKELALARLDEILGVDTEDLRVVA